MSIEDDFEEMAPTVARLLADFMSPEDKAYIRRRYGGEDADLFWQRHHWYSDGGSLDRST